MNNTEQNIPRLEIIWKFVRGDMEPTEFEQWAYSETGLEDQLGESFYLETVSVDYSNKRAVYEIRKSLEAYAREASNLRCECITLPDLADVDMGKDSDPVFRTFEKRAVHGPPLWWLAAHQCSECEQWWLMGQESRINDVYYLKRLSNKVAEQVLKEKQWPEDFGKFETLLRLGYERGHRVTYIEPLISSELLWTMTDIAQERPGIPVSELAKLFNLGINIAKQIAKKAMRDEGVIIDLGQTET